MASSTTIPLPPRFSYPGVLRVIAIIGIFALISISLQGADISPRAFIEGLPYMWDVLKDMFPPRVDRLPNIGVLLLDTFYMAVAGTTLGVLVSFPLAICAARTTTPHGIVYQLARAGVSLARTVPDLVWALFFVVTVGIGAFAGVLTIAVDTLGFCGRFFAESIEETERSPEEALRALGAGKIAILATYILPSCTPSFINTILFSLEKAVRSSVVLGLVGAGGIGVELKVAMDTFQYDEACTIILAIFALVVVVEQISTRARRALLEEPHS
ncbi:MAG: phosphonate ABC transporter, permease protein PhnE [Bdellovibrionales bacterium]|nr:phosphonate ABC transporter, permease protein PhnE [Bdellovibrionales bacterium]